MKKFFIPAAIVCTFVFATTSCNSNKNQTQGEANDTIPATQLTEAVNIVGSWVQPIPGQDGVQGFTLKEDGSAESVNMATLQYETWKAENEQLYLSGKSIGNGQTIPFTDTLEIKSVTADSLTLNLKRGGDSVAQTYHRQ